jgi:hypothetical protein
MKYAAISMKIPRFLYFSDPVYRRPKRTSPALALPFYDGFSLIWASDREKGGHHRYRSFRGDDDVFLAGAPEHHPGHRLLDEQAPCIDSDKNGGNRMFPDANFACLRLVGKSLFFEDRQFFTIVFLGPRHFLEVKKEAFNPFLLDIG